MMNFLTLSLIVFVTVSLQCPPCPVFSESMVGAHHVATVGADMFDILESINAERDQTKTAGEGNKRLYLHI